ncbi:MAG: RNA polymerase sigma factor [Acidobacteriota bacterium]|nr:RNA polymerase sigma factor [Acidobacteriota bacterium]
MDSENRTRYEWIALRCQSGEPGAFEDLIAVMERPLLYYATSLTGNTDSGLDVLQDVWIKAFRGIRGLKEPGSLRAWLYSITHGIAVDRIRRNSSREQAEKVQLDNSMEAAEPSFAEEDSAALHQALSEIGFKHREVLVLHFLEDLSMAEIAKVVGCSEGTVKSRIYYAKKAMKQILIGGGYGTKK